MTDSPYTYDAMESVLDDIRASLWRTLGDNYAVPEPLGAVENKCGLPSLRVKDPTTGHVFLVSVVGTE